MPSELIGLGYSSTGHNKHSAPELIGSIADPATFALLDD